MRTRRRRNFVAVGAALLLGACGSSFSANQLTGQNAKLRPNERIYIAVPNDGRYGATVYSGSGDSVARALEAAFLRHAAHVDRAASVQTLSEALAGARASNAGYLVLPTISHWEDRATEWSGLPDRIEVIISVHEVSSGQLLNRSVLTARSSWWTLGGDRPQDLLANTVGPHVRALF